MQQDESIVITGAAGFIGSYLCGYLNHLGFEKLILVDDFSKEAKWPNLEDKKYFFKIERAEFLAWWRKNPGSVNHCFHLGARTDTTEMDYEIHRVLNLEYSKEIWKICAEQSVPLVYASSAATYGNGDFGYNDNEAEISQLIPLNPYGFSKHQFDLWALKQQDLQPPFWAGLKFFNVYGPNEYHKGRMASVMMHSFNQIRDTGRVKLFRSHNPYFKDGGQMRDFVYVADIASICIWLMKNQPVSGIYNAGSGTARTFIDLVRAVFHAMDFPEEIDFIDTPADIRDKYQYFTEANMRKLIRAGYKQPSCSLEDGITDYVQNFLKSKSYY